MKGNRVQSIVQELKGEKVDIVPWNPDVAKFVCNALAPAEIARVIIDEDNRSMEVIVPDDFLSIAIGKNGQNVRLACRLTGWHLEVMSEDEYSSELKQGYDSLMSIPNVSLLLAEKLFKGGFSSFKEVSLANVDDLLSVTDLSESGVKELILNAKALVDGDYIPEKPGEKSGLEESDPVNSDLVNSGQVKSGLEESAPEELDQKKSDPSNQDISPQEQEQASADVDPEAGE
jgi:N utilization substance protein A